MRPSRHVSLVTYLTSMTWKTCVKYVSAMIKVNLFIKVKKSIQNTFVIGAQKNIWHRKLYQMFFRCLPVMIWLGMLDTFFLVQSPKIVFNCLFSDISISISNICISSIMMTYTTGVCFHFRLLILLLVTHVSTITLYVPILYAHYTKLCLSKFKIVVFAS